MSQRAKLKPESKPLKPTPSTEKILTHEHELAERIVAARADAVRGEIFTPQVAVEFRRLIAITMHGPDAPAIRARLIRAEPVWLNALRVNHRYPHDVPLQSTPPSLLLNLPSLPPELQYRVVGNSLVLLDVGAKLIVDYLPHAIDPVP